MKYSVGMSIEVKCAKGWKSGFIDKIVDDWMYVCISGMKGLKKVNVNWVNMYF